MSEMAFNILSQCIGVFLSEALPHVFVSDVLLRVPSAALESSIKYKEKKN